MKFAKITTITLWVLMGISLIVIISLLSNLDSNLADAGMNSWISTNLYWTYVLLIVVCIAAIVLEFINTISDKQATKSALIGLGFMVAVIGISYLMSSGEIPTFYGSEKFVADGTLTPTVSKWIGTGLIATYILSAISIIAIIWSSISGIFK